MYLLNFLDGEDMPLLTSPNGEEPNRGAKSKSLILGLMGENHRTGGQDSWVNIYIQKI